jgi:hypothetical protein
MIYMAWKGAFSEGIKMKKQIIFVVADHDN